MGGMGNRRSDRISIALPVEASGIDAENHPFIDTATTVVLNRHGARLALKRILQPGQTINLVRKHPDGSQRKAEARIVVREKDSLDVPAYGIAFVDPETDFWGIEFPSRAQASGSVVRILAECTHCHSQELAYLDGRELKEFETDRLFARQCRMCEAPTIWKQPYEAASRQHAAADARREAAGSILSTAENNAREIPRYDTRLTACIRAGMEDEMAVCENVSQQGIAFRSRRKYEVGAQVEVAVPFTAGTANVFIPAVIVHARPLPSAGLHRHGAKYLHKDKD
ncbi:MAG TPA: PilZ domain-containing protein [Candidatus Acidoferrales bacterium]|nr:PilZ domain-containing protein [Candidatus Acidoferrales bacterium]